MPAASPTSRNMCVCMEHKGGAGSKWGQLGWGEWGWGEWRGAASTEVLTGVHDAAHC
jgi:hypothetical protein